MVSSGPNIIVADKSQPMTVTYENLLSAIGSPRYRIIPEFEAGLPITRTGMLYVEFQPLSWLGRTRL